MRFALKLGVVMLDFDHANLLCIPQWKWATGYDVHHLFCIFRKWRHFKVV